MELIIWMNQPSHHQAQFFDSLNEKFDEFCVNYYGNVPSSRAEMGWSTDIQLKGYEQYINPENLEIDLLELKKYIHILPGYGHPFLIKLRNIFSKNNIKWVHWSEKASTGWKWYASYYKKTIHAYYINKYALGALAIGDHAKNDFIKWGIHKNKIEILPYSFNDLQDYVPDKQILDFKKGRKLFLFVGRLSFLKGTDLLIKAFYEKFYKNPEWCLVLVGNQKDKTNYQDLIDQLGLTDQIFIRGVIPAHKISSAYKSCDVFILPSRYDGWGMVVNEALYCNKPIIVSDAVGASTHLIKDDQNGYIFKSADFVDLSNKMSKYKNEDLLLKHSSHSSAIFEKYSSETLAMNLVEILQKWSDENENIN